MKTPFDSHLGEHTLDEWLYYLESLHTQEIDLGLARIGEVAKRLSIDLSFAKVVTVAGTNGKGTTCAFIEQTLLTLGESVAVYSSPHINKFNERLRINARDIDDQPIIDAFKKIERAREEISLSYYEYTTLAAFLVLMDIRPNFIILEVGLGGRLDATNIIDADIAVITTVDLDHQAFLGDTREAIGFEKAGIMRANQLAVIGEVVAANSVIAHADSIGAQIKQRERDFSVTLSDDGRWCWQSSHQCFNHLPKPFVPLDNVATAIEVLSLLSLTLTEQLISDVINKTKVPGRTESFKQGCDIVLDVGHNPLAARYLRDYISAYQHRRILAVVGMLADKDIKSTLNELVDCVDHWYIGSLDTARGATSEYISQQMPQLAPCSNYFDNVEDAFKMAQKQAKETDIILVFGSFYTVAKIRKLLV
ncbi:bifunctional tetrahydrofolate synthase/dihydrofolate synthase [Thalassotalea ganghwensis]